MNICHVPIAVVELLRAVKAVVRRSLVAIRICSYYFLL